ncbi:hypothetical protein DPMN_091312 [Dreissena polymorpha]|uniref:Uncharacterized protein n=1 Tax=Dreissena polymorpha TaxID=45954 RepID=A0A9D4QZW6_DREPO|nr:hypothetical protein DPMN_091312 [Dreissena polymorpha]
MHIVYEQNNANTTLPYVPKETIYYRILQALPILSCAGWLLQRSTCFFFLPRSSLWRCTRYERAILSWCSVRELPGGRSWLKMICKCGISGE